MARVEALLAAAREAGLEVRVRGRRTRGRGPRTQDALARTVAWPKSRWSSRCWLQEDAEVAWRIAAMRPQVPQRGAIPVLVAREWRRPRAVASRAGSRCGSG